MFRQAKDLAYVAVYTALLIGSQFLLSAVPGVELVTLLLTCFAYVFGVARGCLCATVFSLIRQFVFGFQPTVLLLYLIYFNLLCLTFALLGKAWRGKELRRLVFIVLIACACTLAFNFLDILINILLLGFKGRALQIYFTASWTFTLPQIICTAVTVSVGFLPLQKALSYVRSRL
ncbi:MAG: hypothetical protein IKC37_01255 [Clostridia bacterium]|nr:hypothetical protein [Clostridia bacterium]